LVFPEGHKIIDKQNSPQSNKRQRRELNDKLRLLRNMASHRSLNTPNTIQSIKKYFGRDVIIEAYGKEYVKTDINNPIYHKLFFDHLPILSKCAKIYIKEYIKSLT